MNINLISNSLTQADTSLQKEVLAYYEQLQKDSNGWRFAISTLTSGENLNETAVFFCFQLIESHLRTDYIQDNEADRLLIRQFICNWFIRPLASHPSSSSSDVCSTSDNSSVFPRSNGHLVGSSDEQSITIASFLVNKFAAIVVRVFLLDYPTGQWDSFFYDFLSNCRGERTCHIFLRILLQINLEIADRELSRTIKECERNTYIKDKMRDTCLTDLAQFWYEVMSSFSSTSPSLVCLCVNVMGAYISWIDIGLITNEQVMSFLISLLKEPPVRCQVLECFQQIFHKGMGPLVKLQFVQQFFEIPFIWQSFTKVQGEKDEAYLLKLGALLNAIGLETIECTRKLKPKPSITPDEFTLNHLSQAWLYIQKEFELMCQFLSNSNLNINVQVHPFIREYLHFLRVLSTQSKSNEHKVSVDCTIYYLKTALTSNCKYPEDYELDDDADDDEDEFTIYRKSIKTLYENLILLAPNECGNFLCMNLIEPTFKNSELNSKFNELEVSLFFLSLIGEHYNLMGNKEKLESLVQLLITSSISKHPHPCIQLMYFEIINRYEKMIGSSLTHLYPEILVAFLDDRGFKNSNLQVRNRTILMFARFVKAQLKLKNNAKFVTFAEQILTSLTEFVNLDVLPTPDLKQLEHKTSLNEQDPALFECISQLILCCSTFDGNHKAFLFKQIVFEPICKKFKQLLYSAQQNGISAQGKLTNGLTKTDTNESIRPEYRILACQLSHLISLVTFSSKAFNVQSSAKSIGVQSLFLDAFKEFAAAMSLSLDNESISIVQASLRQLLHRYVVCLDDSDIVPLLPSIIEHIFIPNACFSAHTIQELVPLLNQIVSKFKHSWTFQKDLLPFLTQLFSPFVSFIFTLTASSTLDDEDKCNLQKSYFHFLYLFACNDLTTLFVNQDSALFEQILVSMVRGLELNDSVTQKSCLIILRKVFETSDTSSPNDSGSVCASLRNSLAFTEFLYSAIFPACFDAYLKQPDEHPLSNEIGLTLVSFGKFRGEQEFFNFLNDTLVNIYKFEGSNSLCSALMANDAKTYKPLLKQLYIQTKKQAK